MWPDDDTAYDGESVRLAVLRSYRLDGPVSEGAFDHVVQLAADLFDAPTALVSFVGEHEQVFEARVGFDRCKTTRDISFCAHAIASDEVMVVNDARADPRFCDNPLVTGEPFIRFYAGAPIITPAGYRLGTVCVIDVVPRPPLTERQCGLLRSLARTVMDDLERRRLEGVSRAALRMAAATPDAIICSDEVGAVTFWNAAAEQLFGYTAHEIVGRPVATLVPPELVPHHREVMARRFAEGEDAPALTLEVVGLHRDGTRLPIEISLATWCDGHRTLTGFIVRDLSERDRARERMRDLTHVDRLTGLPNRAQFMERVDQTLSFGGGFAMLKVGLDRFKTVNGALGMAAGDHVLTEAASRVREAAGPSSMVARLGADEFGVLLTNGESAANTAILLARSLIKRLGEPFQVGSSICHLGASVGLVAGPDQSAGDMGVDGVLKRALLALQHAKMAGGGRVEVFQPQLGQRAEERRRVEEDLRGALTRGEFELHFQPQVSLAGGDLVGAEALLRWRHPERGLLSPAAFLSILETSVMAVPIGRWIIREACAFAGELACRGVALRMGVNLFAAQLRDEDLFADVAAALASAGLPAASLEIEITETTVLGLEEDTIEPLRRLRALGVGIAFDDYGTGFASLSLLKRYPLTRLKIDREFVRDLRTDLDDAAIVKAVIALGGSLGLDVIAEGIETADQAAALFAFGCREAQGYLFGKPVPAVTFAALHAPSFARAVA